jgi:hypothetical protein
MFNNLMITKLTLTLSMATVLFSCSHNQSGSNETKTDSATAGQTAMNENPKTPAMPPLPFNAVVIKHSVADYSKWKPLFDSDSTFRNAAGMHLIGVARGIENQNEVDIPFRIDDVQKAKAFASDPRLKAVMQKGGVTSAPSVKFIKVLRMSEAIAKPSDFAEITHKVKDFDAWLKVFDAEGSAVRANDGLEDGVLARGIDDPNLVYLVFKITDLAKAKAAFVNPARQKIMHDAGVIGKPEIYFGRDQQ